MKSINPATGVQIKSYSAHTPEETGDIIATTHEAWLLWRQSPFDARRTVLQNLATALREEQETLAQLMTAEMGKAITEARAEIEKCAWVCEHYADHGEGDLQDEAVEIDGGDAFVTYQPLGIVLAVMPWNFPFWQVFRFLAPALMAGNAALLKHASNVPGCALAIEQLCRKAGVSENVFRTLLIPSGDVATVIEDARIKAVTLTGSTEAGRKVAEKAGACLKKTVLELGGSDPYVVLDDADIEHAAKICVKSRLLNAGQSCIAAKRFIVVKDVYDGFVKAFEKEMQSKIMGDPTDEATDIGPQASLKLRDDLHRQVQDSLKAGAECILGGEIPQNDGAFYPPTILTNVEPGMPAFDEELFGPVAAIIKAEDEDQALALANQTSFGLGAAVFTKDKIRGRMIAKTKLAAGSCAVNDLVKSDPRLPFGGIGESGYGRELSRFGIREFVNIKTVTIAD